MKAGLGSLLIVDDDEESLTLLATRLQRRGFQVTLAKDGNEALEWTLKKSFDLILLDVMMPGVNGVEILRTIRFTRSALELPIIMTTAVDENKEIAHTFEIGANDYVTKPIDFSVLLARIQTQLSLRRSVQTSFRLEQSLAQRNQELEAANAEISRANRRMQMELQAAAELQKALLPAGLDQIPGIQAVWTFEPCEELAGDIFNLFRLDDDNLGIYLLDVSGHGVKAALLSVTLSHLLSPLRASSSLLVQLTPDDPGYRLTAPKEVARELNRRFPFDPAKEQFFSLFYGILDLKARQIRYVSAGHPGLLFQRRDHPPVVLQPTEGAIGLSLDAEGDERQLTWEAEDRLYLCSDGILEATNPADEEFGLNRVAEQLQETRALPVRESLSALMGRLREWYGAERPKDDVSILAVEFLDALGKPGQTEGSTG
ncbi:MAG: SpoIIE family protein phosphatase [Planctomycetes bacterium]|nr:SpoIIE family protein phosphatase [Planctomycetota bacterium]